MKTNNYFAAALAATVLLASCTKGPGTGTDQGEKALLTVTVKAPGKTRATGDQENGDKVKNFSVFVTNQLDEIEWRAYSPDGKALDGSDHDAVSVRTSAKHVYVVANAGNITATLPNTPGKVFDMSELNAFIADLNDSENPQSAARWSTGKTASALAFRQVGTEFVADAPVELVFISARIQLTVDASEMTPDYNPEATDKSLKLESVHVLNARGESLLFGNSLIPANYTTGKKFYEGLANGTPVFEYYPAVADYTAAPASLLSDAVADTDFNTVYSYYVFENDAVDAEAFPTIITIKGKYDDKDIYFPIHLAPYEQFTTGSDSFTGITRGKSYEIAVSLTGNPSISGGSYPGETGGTDDPTSPVIGAKVNVTVSVKDWETVALGKVF